MIANGTGSATMPSKDSPHAAATPRAAPVESAGVSSPPRAPAARYMAVAAGLATSRTTNSSIGALASNAACRMSLPLPGSTGSHIDAAPVRAPATAMVQAGHSGAPRNRERSAKLVA
ncbi:hypothetical protein SDC9_138985 [bioreactor metagenome]|uniref:Uncharacterized protein n=1 Tax=bioreactor metagenome TaxID=1076179 RepID=A0A645DRC5_9ZZZZ